MALFSMHWTMLHISYTTLGFINCYQNSSWIYLLTWILVVIHVALLVNELPSLLKEVKEEPVLAVFPGISTAGAVLSIVGLALIAIFFNVVLYKGPLWLRFVLCGLNVLIVVKDIKNDCSEELQ